MVEGERSPALPRSWPKMEGEILRVREREPDRALGWKVTYRNPTSQDPVPEEGEWS